MLLYCKSVLVNHAALIVMSSASAMMQRLCSLARQHVEDDGTKIIMLRMS